MLNQNRGGNDGVVAAIHSGLTDRVAVGDITDGAHAATRTITLMRTVRSVLSPERIITVWGEVGGPSSPDYQLMWQKLGEATGKCMAEGALLLASLWQSAWTLGKGDTHINAIDEVQYRQLRALFEPNGTPGHGEQFLPSLWLNEYPY